MLEPIHIEKFNFWMLPVEGGIFDMGDEVGDLWWACRPVHQVVLSSFYLAQYPVTQALWEEVMEEKPPFYFTGNNRPVECVSWDDARKFIEKLRVTTNKPFRLPTEAEWEFAARGGVYNTSLKYVGSKRLKEVAWFDTNCHNESKPIGQKFRNELGLYDLGGNVGAWCEDKFNGNEYYRECHKRGFVIDPVGPEVGYDRVFRGSSWKSALQNCRTAYRSHWSPSYNSTLLGFRLALSLQSVD